jgi:osmotically-inducible protein OsmY
LNPLFRAVGIIGITLIGAVALGQLQGCVGGIIAAGGAGAAVAVDRRSAGTIVDDEAIELKISAAINEDKDIGEKAHINITSFNYVVLLTGEAPSEAMRDHIVDIARHVEKVRRVYNEIVVAEPTTVKSRSEDAWITGKVKAKLLGMKDVSAANIKVVTENRNVYLMGIVSHAEADAAIEAARFVDGVARVVTLFEYLD